jgi:hypothetical protein
MKSVLCFWSHNNNMKNLKLNYKLYWQNPHRLSLPFSVKSYIRLQTNSNLNNVLIYIRWYSSRGPWPTYIYGANNRNRLRLRILCIGCRETHLCPDRRAVMWSNSFKRAGTGSNLKLVSDQMVNYLSLLITPETLVWQAIILCAKSSVYDLSARTIKNLHWI